VRQASEAARNETFDDGPADARIGEETGHPCYSAVVMPSSASGAIVVRSEVRAVVEDVVNAVARSEAAPNVLNSAASAKDHGFSHHDLRIAGCAGAAWFGSLGGQLIIPTEKGSAGWRWHDQEGLKLRHSALRRP
jgi:hypothetical protein